MTITPNLPELKRLNMWVQTQDQLEPGARIWDQENWAIAREESPMCQTAYCVAGMAITRAGHELRCHSYIIECSCGREDCNWDSYRLTMDGTEVDAFDISKRAIEILGIDRDTADSLFLSSNTASDIDDQIRLIFIRAGANYDATEPAPDIEIEIKSAEVEINAAQAAQTHMKFYTNA